MAVLVKHSEVDTPRTGGEGPVCVMGAPGELRRKEQNK